MKIRYDPEADALSIVFRDTTVTTQHVADGIAADYDKDGLLAGIEVLDAGKRLGGRDTLKKISIEGIGASYPAIREGHSGPYKKT
jgi:uncharacterized protein YuzE